MKKCIICDNKLSGQKKKYCSNKCKQKGHYDRVKEQTNTYHSQTLRSLERKIKLIEMKGGGCNQCGYNKNLSSLEFHHINPDEKESKLDSRILSNRSWKYILEEAKKCELLCSNCHREHHNPELKMDNVIQLLIENKRV
tara:strand:- start:2529 stop:2945 length:417 start_codon:yes stop_codon:yes gene_type:complete